MTTHIHRKVQLLRSNIDTLKLKMGKRLDYLRSEFAADIKNDSYGYERSRELQAAAAERKIASIEEERKRKNARLLRAETQQPSLDARAGLRLGAVSPRSATASHRRGGSRSGMSQRGDSDANVSARRRRRSLARTNLGAALEQYDNRVPVAGRRPPPAPLAQHVKRVRQAIANHRAATLNSQQQVPTSIHHEYTEETSRSVHDIMVGSAERFPLQLDVNAYLEFTFERAHIDNMTTSRRVRFFVKWLNDKNCLAFVEHSFWFFFVKYFQDDSAHFQDLFLQRTAHWYTQLLGTVNNDIVAAQQDQRYTAIATKNIFLLHFPYLIADALYHAFLASFPSSADLIKGEAFRARLDKEIHFLVSGMHVAETTRQAHRNELFPRLHVSNTEELLRDMDVSAAGARTAPTRRQTPQHTHSSPPQGSRRLRGSTPSSTTGARQKFFPTRPRSSTGTTQHQRASSPSSHDTWLERVLRKQQLEDRPLAQLRKMRVRPPVVALNMKRMSPALVRTLRRVQPDPHSSAVVQLHCTRPNQFTVLADLPTHLPIKQQRFKNIDSLVKSCRKVRGRARQLTHHRSMPQLPRRSSTATPRAHGRRTPDQRVSPSSTLVSLDTLIGAHKSRKHANTSQPAPVSKGSRSPHSARHNSVDSIVGSLPDLEPQRHPKAELYKMGMKRSSTVSLVSV